MPKLSKKTLLKKKKGLKPTKNEPEKSLLHIISRKAGRGKNGKITVYHRGGGHKRKYRLIDFKRNKFDIPAEVLSIEYDPFRTCYIALIRYADGEKRYILAPEKIKVGAKLMSSLKRVALKEGNHMPLKYIPAGSSLHNVELFPGKGGQLGRSAGASIILNVVEGGYAQLKLPSGEVRKVKEDCSGTIGQLSNIEHNTMKLYKAGQSRWRGIRPTVRGSAMSPSDHPHGGGEGRSPIGLRRPKTPWGKAALGARTRKKHKWSNKMIIKRRKK